MTRAAVLFLLGAILVLTGLVAPADAQLRVSNLPSPDRNKEPAAATLRPTPDRKRQRKEIAEQLIAVLKLGYKIDMVIPHPVPSHVPKGADPAYIERFATEVMPIVRDAIAA